MGLDWQALAPSFTANGSLVPVSLHRYHRSMLDVEKMKALREARGLTMTQAASDAGMGGRRCWNQIESGRRTNVPVETLQQIARALGVTVAELLK